MGRWCGYTVTWNENNSLASTLENTNAFIWDVSGVGFDISLELYVNTEYNGYRPQAIKSVRVLTDKGRQIASGGRDTLTVSYAPAVNTVTNYRRLTLEVTVELIRLDGSEKTTTVDRTEIYVPYKVDYHKPFIQAEAVRDMHGATQRSVIVRYWCSFYQGSFGKSDNEITIKIRYKKVDTSTWGDYVTLYRDKTIDNPKESYLTFDVDQAYDIELQATDTINNVATCTAVVYKASPLWVEHPNCFCIYGELHLHDPNQPGNHAVFSYPVLPKGTVLRVAPDTGEDEFDVRDRLQAKFGGTWDSYGPEQINDTHQGVARVTTVYTFIRT